MEREKATYGTLQAGQFYWDDKQLCIALTFSEDYPKGSRWNVYRNRQEIAFQEDSVELPDELERHDFSARYKTLLDQLQTKFGLVFFPLGYVGVDQAPENVELEVVFGIYPRRCEYRKASRIGNQWFYHSDPNPFSGHYPCATPLAFKPLEG